MSDDKELEPLERPEKKSINEIKEWLKEHWMGEWFDGCDDDNLLCLVNYQHDLWEAWLKERVSVEELKEMLIKMGAYTKLSENAMDNIATALHKHITGGN